MSLYHLIEDKQKPREFDEKQESPQALKEELLGKKNQTNPKTNPGHVEDECSQG